MKDRIGQEIHLNDIVIKCGVEQTEEVKFYRVVKFTRLRAIIELHTRKDNELIGRLNCNKDAIRHSASSNVLINITNNLISLGCSV